MNGKKILVLSDSHGKVSALKTVFSWARDRIPPKDTICGAAFCGDGIADLSPAADAAGFFCDWQYVSGNNDFDYSTPQAVIFEFCEHRFYMCHGHRHSLYGGYHALISSARNSDAGVALFGHSHVPFCETMDGITLVNPGSIGRPRSRIGATFAVIECAEGEPVKTEFFRIGEKSQIISVKI
ncbi:MAG: YfcE family phosphodiesterase [Treponema sp.]|jgi:putative phosphoesterase|nr:YfcE family phosphodiesterase [Treponema sp.]